MTIIEQLERSLGCASQSGKSPIVSEYEAALCSFFSSNHALAVNSGSAAIQTALVCLGAAPGRTVIVSAAAPLPTLLPIAATGARIKFVDCYPDNPAIDPATLMEAIDDTVVAVVEVPLWGYPQDYTALLERLAPFGIALVEDAAQAHGARCGGRYVGTLGTVGCFSTHEKKFLSTGEGGFILTDDAQLHERTKRYARLGALSGADFGMNFKISAFTAAVGLSRLEQLPAVLEQKRQVRRALLSHLGPWAAREIEHVGEPNGYNLVIDCAQPTPGLHAALADAGIKTDVVAYGYKPGYRHKLFAGLGGHCPHAEALTARVVQFPNTTADPAALARGFIDTLAAPPFN